MLRILPFDKLTDIEVICIKQAAEGIQYNTLSNSPYIRDAFVKLGLPTYWNMIPKEIINICKLIVKVW